MTELRRGRRALAALGAVGLALAGLWSTPAFADPKDDARRHFAEGLAAAQAGDYKTALEAFLAAQAAYPHPATVYNIARAYADLGDLQAAVDYYHQFQSLAPEQAATVAPVVADLEARIAASKAPAPAPAPTTAVVAAAPVAGAPTADELTRLEAIASELASLQASLRERAAAAPAPAPEGGGETGVAPAPQPTGTGEVAQIQTPIDQPDFLSDAYERTVVTASRVGQDPLDSPSTVTIITRDEIRASPAYNLADLLRRVAGVDAMQLASSQTEISIRGFNRELSNKVLILVDGRSTQWDLLASSLLASVPLVPDEIERIEVIRGPASAIYGANAVTGVVNIITTNPGEEAGATARVDYGMPDLQRVTGVVSGRDGATAYRVSGGFSTLGRWAKESATDATVDTQVPFTENQDRSMDTLMASARIDRTFGKKGFGSISGGLNDGTSELYNIGALGDYGLEARTAYIRGDAAYDFLHFRALYASNNGRVGPWLETVGSSQGLTSKIQNDAASLELEAPLSFATGPVKHQLNIGASYTYKLARLDYLAGPYEEGFTQNMYALYLNEQASWQRLSVVVSGRVDAHPLIPIGETISPRGSVIYRLFDKTSLRATAGTAFRAPDMVESYMDFNLNSTSANGAYVEDFGNQELSPERIFTVEAGVHDESSYFHRADAVVYYNHVTDLIGLDAVTLAPNPLDQDANGFEVGETGWINLPSTYSSVGVETELDLFPIDGLDLFTNLDIQQTVEDTGEEKLTDKSTSAVKVNAGGTWRTPVRTDLTFVAHYTSPQIWRLREFDALGNIEIQSEPVAARTLLEARVAVRPFAKDDLEFAVNAWNFLAFTRSPEDLAAAAAEVASSTEENPVFAPTGQEHPKGQPVGGMLFGSIRYHF